MKRRRQVYRPCPETDGSGDWELKNIRMPGREMNVETVLLVMSLSATELYALGEIARDRTDYTRLYAYANNRCIEADGKKWVSGKEVKVYWGASLQNALPDRSKCKGKLILKVVAISKTIQKKRQAGLSGWLAKRAQEIKFTGMIAKKPARVLFAGWLGCIAEYLHPIDRVWTMARSWFTKPDH